VEQLEAYSNHSTANVQGLETRKRLRCFPENQNLNLNESINCHIHLQVNHGVNKQSFKGMNRLQTMKERTINPILKHMN